MQGFAYHRAEDEQAAVALAEATPGAAFVAGGTELLQLWKAGLCAPTLLVDISRLALGSVAARAGAVGIGALARLSDVADHPLIRHAHPMIAQALLASASPQIRNAATVGGNLLQRTRCLYFRHHAMACNKRRPGSGCGAREGENRAHAIFGASPHCAATHASDLAVALVAADATVRLRGPRGERSMALDEFLLPPGEDPGRDTAILPGELIVEIEVPDAPPGRRSGYLKVRDRATFEFALVSAAIALDIEAGVVRRARLAAGGVGTTPWRLRQCEAALTGARADSTSYRRAAAVAAEGARPLKGNGFKAELLRRTVFRALEDFGGGA